LVTDRLLHDPARHEPLRQIPWDEGQARTAIERIVSDVESRYTEDAYWPRHPLDREGEKETRPAATSLYNGACGVFWALRYLHSVGAVSLSGSCVVEFDRLLARNRGELGASAERDRASLMLGDTPIQMMRFDEEPTDQIEDALHNLIAGNVGHPARELLWGSPGTLLAALFLYERTGNRRWSDLFRLTADTLWNQLEWSPSQLCSYWTQDFMGRRWNHLGAMHGFVAAVPPLVRGRHLLDAGRWAAWEECIVNTVSRTADRSGAHANWRPQLDYTTDVTKRLLQFCHGAPGFVICLAGLPSAALDDLLLAAGENIWSAGPLTKGSNLCHGTGGNGYALLKLFQRTRDDRWLERARSFAMHGIAQTQADARRFGQSRYSLWTGDPGFAIYLWDCLRAEAQFPTLDIFYAPRARGRPPVTLAHRAH
jgi:lantibiotic modifying enzyme